MSTGTDFSIGLYDGTTKAMVSLGAVQNFRSSAQKHNIKNMPYNAPPIFGFIPDGYSGRFSILRTDPTFENLFLQLMNTFNNGGELIPGYINQTIQESQAAGGGISRYQYTQAVFFLTEDGEISHDKNVPQTVEWMASTKVKVS